MLIFDIIIKLIYIITNMIKGKRKIEKLKEHRALINAKSKRRRNLIKKAMELSIKCEVDVFLIIRD